mgnify:CR=1 FL=1
MTESPRWLLSQGRHEAAREYFRKSAKYNKKILPKDFDVHLISEVLIPFTCTSFRLQITIIITDNNDNNNNPVHVLLQTKKEGSVLTLFQTPNLRSKTLIVAVLWFTVSIVFFGMNYNVGELIRQSAYLILLLSVSVFILSKLRKHHYNILSYSIIFYLMYHSVESSLSITMSKIADWALMGHQ